MPGGHETVLLVEDESSVRRLVRIILDTLGYRVIEASSGAQALQVAATEPEVIDILVTDVVMPGMGGRELAVQLTRVRPNLRVLYMSGYTDDTVQRNGVLEAEVAFVAKPFNAESLALTLRETLDRLPIPG
jgi:CheY-like chemotaxis protein